MNKNIKISLITVTYNSIHTIENCLNSVISQNYKNIEHIVIDGASSDGTFELLKSRKDDFSVLISEPDDGMYFALNKAIKYATGDIIGFLHSDDLYQDNTVIEKVAQAFINNATDSVYGDLTYVNKSDPSKIIRFWQSGEFTLKKLNYGWMPPHPTFFVRRSIYQQYGCFDTHFKIADAKRGDIGNTSKQYAKTFFETLLH